VIYALAAVSTTIPITCLIVYLIKRQRASVQPVDKSCNQLSNENFIDNPLYLHRVPSPTPEAVEDVPVEPESFENMPVAQLSDSVSNYATAPPYNEIYV